MDVVETLVAYRELCKKHENHQQLLKDKTVILYAATLLENKNLEIVTLCLDILESFIKNTKTHNALMSTFGLFESLECLSINARSNDRLLAQRAADLCNDLRISAPPAYGTRLRSQIGKKPGKMTVMYHLYIAELTVFSRASLDETLVNIKGMVSFVVDTQQQRCTIRLGPKVDVRHIVERILEETAMKALVIAKNLKTGKQELVDVLLDTHSTTPLDYLIEDTQPSGKQALYYYTQHFAKNAGSFLKTAANLWNKSFYW